MDSVRGFFYRRVLWNICVFDISVVVSWWVLFGVIWANMLVYDGRDYWTGSSFVWADWSVHIIYIFNFAYRSLILLSHPLYLGEPFRYHFVADLLSALLVRSGATLIQATIIPSILASFALVIASYILYLSVWKRRSIAALAMALFFFNGGLGFIWFFIDFFTGKLAQYHPPPLYLLTEIQSAHIAWLNFIVAEFIPQRGFLLGAPIVLFLLFSLWRMFESPHAAISGRKLFGLGVLCGILPLVHIHSFFVVVLVLCFIMAVEFFRYRRVRLVWFFWILPMVALALPQLWYLSYGGGQGFIRFNPGWIADKPGESLVWFWFNNIGVMAILIPVAFFFTPPSARVFSIPFMLLFVACNILTFQPNMWDNRKFFLYWYFFSAGIVSHFLLTTVWSKRLLSQILVAMLILCAIFSGFVDVTNLLQFEKQKYKLFSAEDIKFTKQIRTRTEKNAIFLTGPTTSWVAMILGRQVVMGLDFWLTTYGYDIKNRKDDIVRIYAGDPMTPLLLDKYTVDFVIIGDRERQSMVVNDAYFIQHFPVFAKQRGTVIYDVRQRAY